MTPLLEAGQTEIRHWNIRCSRIRKVLELLTESAKRWLHDQIPRLSAALAYYTVFSMAPLLILAIAIAGLVFGREAAQGQIIDQLTGMIGPKSAEVIQGMIQGANQPSKSIAASVVSCVTLIVGATGVLSELKKSLNKMWEVSPPAGWTSAIKQNLQFLGVILSIGFILLVSLAISAGLASLGKFMGSAMPIPETWMQTINFIISFAVITALFATLYKVLPNAIIAWKDVWIGAAVTSLLFSVGKLGMGLYLGKSVIGSSYGTAGSALILLLWVYYSGLIFYFGAEFTKVYADRFGSRAGLDTNPREMKKVA